MQFTSLNINQTWEGIILLENQITISSKWILKIKTKINGTIDKLGGGSQHIIMSHWCPLK